jgi:uncharacterized protein (TIGR02246 family)
MPRHVLALSVLVILAAASIAQTAEKAEKIAADSREGEIRKAIASLEENFNHGDAKNLAACWAPNGEFVGPRGEQIVGREMIEGAFRDFLTAHPASKLRLGVASLHMMTDGVALVHLVPKMTPVPEGVEAEPVSTMVLVKHEGRWLIGSMHETLSGAPAHHVQLENLNWLVGDWENDGGGESGVSAHSTCDWTSNHSYLIRKFTTEVNKDVTRAGTEVIGWDPRAHRIRSWTFDSDGGFGESVWTHDGDQWTIRYAGTRANGGDVSATHVVALVDADHMTVQAKDRLVNGVKQSALPEIKLKRCHAGDEATSRPREPAKLPQRVLP